MNLPIRSNLWIVVAGLTLHGCGQQQPAEQAGDPPQDGLVWAVNVGGEAFEGADPPDQTAARGTTMRTGNFDAAFGEHDTTLAPEAPRRHGASGISRKP